MTANDWTLATLKHYVETLIQERDIRYKDALSAQEKAITAALLAANLAVAKAEAAAEKRFEAVNEFRGTLSDQQRTLMPRNECEVEFRGVYERLVALEKLSLESRGKSAGHAQSWGVLLGAVSLVATVIGWAILLFKVLP